MKAIRVHEFGEPGVMRLEEVPAPSPGPGQVLVAIRAAGVNPVETYIRSGLYARKPALPYTPGSDGAGAVEAAGEGVSGVAVGERVYTSGSLTGTYAEKALCGAEQVYPLPARVSFSQGAGIHVPYVTAYRALIQRGRAPGEPVAIVMITHEAVEGTVKRALKAIAASDKVFERPSMIPMEAV